MSAKKYMKPMAESEYGECYKHDIRWFSRDIECPLCKAAAELAALHGKIEYVMHELSMGDDNRPLEALVRHAKSELAARDKALLAARDKLVELRDWTKAYPVDIYPQPDFKRAHEILKNHGMTIDTISASNFRFILEMIEDKVAAALAALEEEGK